MTIGYGQIFARGNFFVVVEILHAARLNSESAEQIVALDGTQSIDDGVWAVGEEAV